MTTRRSIGLIEDRDGRIVLTMAGRLLANEVTLRLHRRRHRRCADHDSRPVGVGMTSILSL